MAKKRKFCQRLTSTGYADVLLSVIRAKPQATCYKVSAAVGTTETTARILLRKMYFCGVIDVVDRVPNKRGFGPYVPVYELSKAMTERSGQPAGKHFRKTELVAFCEFIKALSEGLQSRQMLVERSGLNYHTVLKLVRHCRDIKLIRVDGWEVQVSGHGGAPIELFGIGSRADEPKPRPMPNAERCRAYYHRRAAAEASMAIAQAFVRKQATEPEAVAA